MSPGLGPYERSADVYDLLYGQMVDYETLSTRVEEIIRERAPQAASLLEVACGTGLYLEQLAAEFDVVGLDIAPQMLERAGERLPGVDLHEADMRSFDLGRGFDAVICLFSSVAYLTTTADLAAALGSMARHLNPGGVVLVEPWFAPGEWRDGYVAANAARSDELAVGRVSSSVREGRIVTMHWAFAIARPNGRVETYVEVHRTGQFTVDEHLAAFADAGLEAEHDPEGLLGRGLYLAVKPHPDVK